MVRVRTMLWALIAALTLSFAVVPTGTAEAAAADEAKQSKKKKKKAKRAKKKRKAKAAAKAPVPQANNKAISELMGDFKFGMAPKQVMSVLDRRISAKYKDQIAETTDVYQQDQLRRKMSKEKKKLRKSFIGFKGQRNGWDVSIIDEEYGHKNQESMLVFWDRDARTGVDQRRFFFFVDDALYKMYIAFDAKMFPPGKRQFAYFQQIMENRYGPGELIWAEDRYGTQRVKHLHWKNDKYYLRAVNRMEFYGTFCLALSDPSVETWIGDRRAQNSPETKKENSIIRAITQEEDKEMSLDEANSDVVDAIINN